MPCVASSRAPGSPFPAVSPRGSPVTWCRWCRRRTPSRRMFQSSCVATRSSLGRWCLAAGLTCLAERRSHQRQAVGGPNLPSGFSLIEYNKPLPLQLPQRLPHRRPAYVVGRRDRRLADLGARGANPCHNLLPEMFRDHESQRFAATGNTTRRRTMGRRDCGHEQNLSS